MSADSGPNCVPSEATTPRVVDGIVLHPLANIDVFNVLKTFEVVVVWYDEDDVLHEGEQHEGELYQLYAEDPVQWERDALDKIAWHRGYDMGREVAEEERQKIRCESLDPRARLRELEHQRSAELTEVGSKHGQGSELYERLQLHWDETIEEVRYEVHQRLLEKRRLQDEEPLVDSILRDDAIEAQGQHGSRHTREAERQVDLLVELANCRDAQLKKLVDQGYEVDSEVYKRAVNLLEAMLESVAPEDAP